MSTPLFHQFDRLTSQDTGSLYELVLLRRPMSPQRLDFQDISTVSVSLVIVRRPMFPNVNESPTSQDI